MAEAEREADRHAFAPDPMREPYLTVDGFLPAADAQAMRGRFEAHFKEPHGHRPETHQVWNYWHVPDLYTYLRTAPEKLIPRPLLSAFHERLTLWARQRLGLGFVTWPNLSLYVDGCVQHLHNDATNGRFGFVYSLTPDGRRSAGGETIVLREGDLFRRNARRPAAGPALQDLVEPRFNRLTVFDDRMPHGVRRVEGGMDPLEGRVVLHGHISEEAPRVSGPLAARDAWEAAWEVADAVLARVPDTAADCHGPLTLRVAVGADGGVRAVRPLVDRVVRTSGAEARELVDGIVAGVEALRFPAAGAPSEAILPIMIGGPLPWMKDDRRIVRAAAPPQQPARARLPASDPVPDDPKARVAALASVRRRLAAAAGVSRIPKDRLEAYVVADFLSREEADRLVALVGPGEEGPLVDGACPIAAAVAERLDSMIGIDPACAEPWLGVRVGPSGREARFDFVDPDDPAWPEEQERGGQRTWTAALFLDRPAAGGQMLFPNVGLRLTPAPGYLLLWSSLAPDGGPNGFAVYETLPVETGSHCLIVRHYRERPGPR